MNEDDRPDDLIGLDRAAVLAERSRRSVRRWTKQGKLRHWVGSPPAAGGPAPILVSARDLMVLLADTGQQPRSDAVPSVPDTPGAALGPESAPALGVSAPPSAAVQVAILQTKLEASELRADLARTTAERDALRRQVADLLGQVEEHRRRWELERSDRREEQAHARDRLQALEAELRALRGAEGQPWWRRLLPGPAPALPEAK